MHDEKALDRCPSSRGRSGLTESIEHQYDDAIPIQIEAIGTGHVRQNSVHFSRIPVALCRGQGRQPRRGVVRVHPAHAGCDVAHIAGLAVAA